VGAKGRRRDEERRARKRREARARRGDVAEGGGGVIDNAPTVVEGMKMEVVNDASATGEK
jgi:hypothetical protein